MAKFVSDTVIDQALNYIKNNAEQVVICAGQPSNYSDATTDSGSGGNALGESAVSTGDFTVADGDTSGRKITMGTKSVTIDVTGTADHVALVDDTNTELLLVTTMASSSVTASEIRTIEAFDEEILDAS